MYILLFFSHRYSVQDNKILRNRNEEEKYSIRSINNKLNANEHYDPNQNKYYKINGNMPHIHNGTNGSSNGQQRERYQQHPALAAIISESQGMKFRG